ncbi:hypothetical protein EDB92DRAFT_1896009 [Lactarius akahatsu]|uniref:Uncharacterized protein n=1 Tax=Lactarius akahatsu TaxID=416441 RepID=A0AAD4L633_9AGAM|nr:hypothetical protein EDB92DRAFT_1896009 [Lactarius akahatsu]
MMLVRAPVWGSLFLHAIPPHFIFCSLFICLFFLFFLVIFQFVIYFFDSFTTQDDSSKYKYCLAYDMVREKGYPHALIPTCSVPRIMICFRAVTPALGCSGVQLELLQVIYRLNQYGTKAHVLKSMSIKDSPLGCIASIPCPLRRVVRDVNLNLLHSTSWGNVCRFFLRPLCAGLAWSLSCNAWDRDMPSSSCCNTYARVERLHQYGTKMHVLSSISTEELTHRVGASIYCPTQSDLRVLFTDNR